MVRKSFIASLVIATLGVFILFTRTAQAKPDIAMRVKVTQVGAVAPTVEQSFKASFGGTNPVTFKGDAWSEWFFFAGYNDEERLAVGVAVVPEPAIDPFPRIKLSAEMTVEDGEKTTNTADLFGPTLSVMLWKSGDKVHVDTRAGHTARVYGPFFKAAAIPENERPRQILFGDRFILGSWEDNNALSWKEGIGGLAGLGINAHTFEGINQPALAQVIRDAGIKKVWGAVYEPPGYAFNFNLDRKKVFDEFVQKQIAPVLNAGWKKEDIGYWVTSDEPGWYFPSVYNNFNNDPNALDAFHAYLKANGQTPALLGKASWADVRLIGRKQYKDLPSRRLFYWSNRFVPWASSKFFAEVTRSYEEAIRPGVPVLVNFNNFMGLMYNPGPVANNPDKTSPNGAMGQHDWLEFGRERGSTAIATEDWFGDWAASYWSFYAARLRSAAELSGDPKVGFGGLIIPRVSGDPGGMPRKIMALVGNGAKTVEFFIFGPESQFPGNTYSENFPVYKEIAAGTRLVGKAEDLLFPGKTRRPEVALLTPQSSQFWDLEEQEVASGLYEATNTNMHGGRMEYTSEMFSIYHTLQRSAIPMNFVDEKSLTEDSLKNYKVLYVTAPDLPTESIDGLLRWVRAGGTLVTLPGAGQNDRYHQPLGTLNVDSGIRPAKAVRELSDWGGATASGSFTVGGEKVTAYGRREALTATDAKVIHTFEDGAPALTEKTLGTGRILHYAFLPGLSYYRATADTTIPDRLNAGTGMRLLLGSPLQTAGVNLPVTVNRGLIEAPALYSDKGVAVTLLNYGEETKNAAIKEVEVTVDTPKPVTRAESVQSGKLEFEQKGNKTTVKLPLGDVDVLKLYY